MDMETSDTAAQCIAQLEKLNKQVMDALIANEVGRIEELVVEQCVWARKLQGSPVGEAERERLKRLTDAIQAQQALVGQALLMVEGVMQTLAGHLAFSRVG